VTARIIDGKAFAARLRDEIAEEIAEITAHGRPPGLAVIQVGNDPASTIYVRNKKRAAESVGIKSFSFDLPEETRESQLLATIERCNTDHQIDGILVQLPLPPHIDKWRILNAVDPAKDVDGLHPVNAGKLSIGGLTGGGLIPCTPQGCIILIKSVWEDLRGANAVVVGASNLVGKPMGDLLLHSGCTVTTCHILSRDVPLVTRTADILVTATGVPGLIKGDWVKPGATVIDVGIARSEDGKSILGDADRREVQDVAGALTPVPGGVGPMTIACLLRNTMAAFHMRWQESTLLVASAG
jgi:methylenetetrahydrofolate dehydrogenase (NADP+)/methenyltetrahydrofolate cyclohydrolase